ncbi:MAG: hypothetical protein HYT12_04705 [Candidatus Liptonbacteria bacterium]|nr:hypothetical protein [Candidatus Liptonbacteria bacterium]
MNRFFSWLLILILMGVFAALFVNRKEIVLLSEFDKYLDIKQSGVAVKKVELKAKIAVLDELQAKERAIRIEAKSNSYSNPRQALQKEWNKFLISFWSVLEALLIYRLIIYAALCLLLLKVCAIIYRRIRI